MKLRTLQKILVSLGWVHTRTKGSHQTWKRESTRNLITVKCNLDETNGRQAEKTISQAKR